MKYLLLALSLFTSVLAAEVPSLTPAEAEKLEQERREREAAGSMPKKRLSVNKPLSAPPFAAAWPWAV